MGKVTAVLFDIGGVLESYKRTEETTALAISSVDEYLRKRDVVIDNIESRIKTGWQEYLAYSHKHNRELRPAEICGAYLFRGFADEVAPYADRLLDIYEECQYEHALIPGALDVVKRLHGLGYRLGIVSNNIAPWRNYAALDRYGLRQYFQTIIISSNIGYRKPDKFPFILACAQLNVLPSEAVHVGDKHDRDVLGARAANLAGVIQIASTATFPDIPDRLIQDLKGLPECIFNWR